MSPSTFSRARFAPLSARTAPARPRCSTSSTASTSRNRGRITFKGAVRNSMRPYAAAQGGIARTFQNLALFRGMTTLDNIMAGRTLKMHCGFFWQLLRYGPAMAEEIEHRHRVEEIIDFLEIAGIRRCRSDGSLMACRSGSSSAAHWPWSPTSAARRADGRHEHRRERGHVALHPRHERNISAPRSR